MIQEKKIKNTNIKIIKDDLTLLETDAIVFYAEENLALGSGYGTALNIRGGPSIQKECNEIGAVKVGEVAITLAGDLKSKYVIHAVGPKFQEKDTEAILRQTIKNTLKKSEEKDIRKIAFPPMGTGFYGVPIDLSAKVTLEEIVSHIKNNTKLEEVVICLRDNYETDPFVKNLESLN
jgi:O-acetyl-ADP-ribose deacetylase (regulator of RNase III)